MYAQYNVRIGDVGVMRGEILESFLSKFGLEGRNDGLGRPTNIAQLLLLCGLSFEWRKRGGQYSAGRLCALPKMSARTMQLLEVNRRASHDQARSDSVPKDLLKSGIPDAAASG